MTRLHRQMSNPDRRGIVLVVALLIMAVMSIIGVTAITTSRIDINISQNTKVSRQAFYFADGGIEVSPKIIRYVADKNALPVIPGLIMNAGLVNEVLGYAKELDANDRVDPTPSNPDLTWATSESSVMVDIDRAGTAMAAGGGVEFAAGAEGAGVGAAGGVMIFYSMMSAATAPTNAKSLLDVYYRLVVGVAGGK